MAKLSEQASKIWEDATNKTHIWSSPKVSIWFRIAWQMDLMEDFTLTLEIKRKTCPRLNMQIFSFSQTIFSHETFVNTSVLVPQFNMSLKHFCIRVNPYPNVKIAGKRDMQCLSRFSCQQVPADSKSFWVWHFSKFSALIMSLWLSDLLPGMGSQYGHDDLKAGAGFVDPFFLQRDLKHLKVVKDSIVLWRQMSRKNAFWTLDVFGRWTCPR